jgi:hypothetical protein
LVIGVPNARYVAPDGAGGSICIKKHQQSVLLAIFG